SAGGIRRACAAAARLGQTSASIRTIRAGRIAENARRMIGQQSSGVYMTSIQGGALLRANANPVVVVVVSTHHKFGSITRNAFASFNATFTSPTLTACSHVERWFERRRRTASS